MTRVICLWEAPRSRGTSISFALFHGLKANGFHCLFRDEPFHWRRLRQIEDEKGTAARDAYIQDIKTPKLHAADFIIQKEQAKWLFDPRTRGSIGADLSWIKTYANIILLRDAREMVTSHQRKLSLEEKKLDLKAVGIEQLYNVFQYLEKNDEHFAVADANELLANPERGMRKLCERLGMPFSEGMIKWTKPDIQPPPWGTHWYEDIMNSDGLRPHRVFNEKPPLTARLNQLAVKAQAIIEKMRLQRLHFDSMVDGGECKDNPPFRESRGNHTQVDKCELA